MAGLVLKNGFVVTPAGVVPGGIASEDGVITVVAASGSLPKGDPEIDVHGSFILPGVIDPHVHLGTGGAHGVSWVTTKLSRDGVSLLQLAKEAIPSRSPIDVRYTANPCTDDHLDEISNLVEQSVTSFKMFPSYGGAAAEEFGITTVDMSFIFRALEIIVELDEAWRPTQGMVHCEEPGICDVLKARYRVESETLEWWTKSRPAICEAIQIFDVGMIAKETGARVYIPHVSSEEGIRTLEYLRSRGADVVGETCPHYLVPDYPWHVGALGKVNPPVRDNANVEYLWHGILSGVLDVIGSDNCRISLAEKRAKSMWDAIPGFSEIAETLPLLLSHGIAAGRIDWPTLAHLTAESPARRFAMYPRKGALQPGAEADAVVVDPTERWVLHAADLPSAAEFSIYEGMEMIGRPRMTVRRGEVIAEGGWVADHGGQYVESTRPS